MAISQRGSGILLHPTSLPGPHGIGSLGEEALRFVDFLLAARQKYWQVLPLSPTGYGNSPYASYGSFAGNTVLIDLRRLAAEGLLDASDLAHPPEFPQNQVDYALVRSWKGPLLNKAAARFRILPPAHLETAYESFCDANAAWLEDFTLFAAAKEVFDAADQADAAQDSSWTKTWVEDLALRDPAALSSWRERLSEEIERHRVLQFLFFEQWQSVRKYANDRGIQIIGDMPIFVAEDSADVWASPEMFQLDEHGKAKVVAGVPPDYFSATGQRWGNPIYDWRHMKATDFVWWKLRFAALFQLVDLVRIDHFRGFQACWEIPAACETAMEGEWVEAPGHDLFDSLRRDHGPLPLIAEDLGVITDEVNALRDAFGFPGMRIIQFDLEALGSEDMVLPHEYLPNCVVYPGTHDNNTTRAWYRELDAPTRKRVHEFYHRELTDPSWELMHTAMHSPANLVVTPMQDVLRLNGDARMNRPGKPEGNWSWRMTYDQAVGDGAAHAAGELSGLTAAAGRE